MARLLHPLEKRQLISVALQQESRLDILITELLIAVIAGGVLLVDALR